ncbi:MAG TPA: FAD-binding protein, partial [Alphaproteobacteria bacterium]
MTAGLLTPRDAADVLEIARDAVEHEAPLEILGHGSKRGFGRPVQASRTLDLSQLSGITLYEPDELVLRAGAGTPLALISRVLAEKRQQLAFEPGDWGPLYGTAPGLGTLGGAIAANLAGPRRIKAGAARDHILGFTAVNGRGEAFKAGGRVMKNVTGYDLPKLMAGSFGTLAILTEVTVKVLPAPEAIRTLLIAGLEDARAVAAMSQALGSAHEVSAAAHLPTRIAARSGVRAVALAGRAVTALRLDGPEPSA